ncbi:phosphatase PAP2 family protein [Aquitalea sp. S1-19]|nr:phosphatase PAP2 family protein [Aquitalea sp. S1-19]
MSVAVPFTMISLDNRIVIGLNQFMHRWPQLDSLLAWAMDAAIIKFLPMVLVICWLWFSDTPEQLPRRNILLTGLLTSLATLFIARFMALLLPFRARPYTNPDLHFVTITEGALRTWSSFPSDHAVLAFALATTIYRISPRLGTWAFLHATVFICLPRLYLGMHYPSDLAVGALIGVLLVLLTIRIPASKAASGALLKIERHWPQWFYATGFLILFEISEMFDSLRQVAGSIFHMLRQ